MNQNYFMHNEQKYYIGTKIRIRPYGGNIQTATFIDYNPETDEYRFGINEEIHTHNSRWWKSYFIGIDGDDSCVNNHAKEWSFNRELNIYGMLNAWLWYVVLMVLSTFFKGNFVYWIIISVFFFTYRNEKLRKAGYKT